MRKDKVKSLVMEFTSDSPYHIMFLTGPLNISKRQAILEAITGNKELKSKCGINRVEAELFELFNVTGESLGGKLGNLADILTSEERIN